MNLTKNDKHNWFTFQSCFHVALLYLGANEHRTSPDEFGAGQSEVQFARAAAVVDVSFFHVVIPVVDVHDLRVAAAATTQNRITRPADQIFTAVTSNLHWYIGVRTIRAYTQPGA